MQEESDVSTKSQFIPPVGKLNNRSGFQQMSTIPSVFLHRRNHLAKSASFHKLKQSFESRQYDDSESEDDEDVVKGSSDQRSQIECELEEIRSSTKIQKMFSINKPKYSNQLERSSSSSAIPDHAKVLMEEGMPTVSEARNSIKNIFEASASKVTYGGGKSLTEQLREKEKTPEPQPAKKKVQFSDRTWVLNTINKYFDVIDEDEDEGEYDYYEDEDEEEIYSDEEEEEDDQVFSTQVSAQRVVYGALPQHLPPKVPQFTNQQECPEESEEEYEEELEIEDEDEEEESEEEVEEEAPRFSTSLLQKSASSSRIRGLFHSVLQKSESGADMDVSNFKANLTRHLKRRESFNSSTNLTGLQREAYRSDSESDDDFEDCQEDPVETNKFYRIPL